MRIRCTNNHAWFYQWDLNQRLLLDGCPDDVEVQFSSMTDGTESTLIVEPYEDEGVMYADVPNILLQYAGNLNVYIYDAAAERTLCRKIIKVLLKERPADYIYTETEVKSYEALEKRIDELEEKGVSEERIKEAVDAYLEENPVDTGIDFTIGNALRLTEDGTLNVVTTDDAEKDNTLPITSAGVHTIVGNIGAILDTI